MLITFLLSQILQGRLLGWLYEKYDRIGLLLFILAIPISAVVSWYCYDYLVPNNPGFIFDAPEDELFHHGLTVSRYLTILGIQAAISIFSVTRFIFAEKYTRSVKALFFLALITVAVLYGVGKGARACNLIDTKSSAVSNKY